MKPFLTHILLSCLSLVISITTLASEDATPRSIFLRAGSLKVRYQIHHSRARHRNGDILYFHGYGDSVEYHPNLVDQWNLAGLRVIGFDLPSHGKTTGTMFDDLDFHSFESLTEIANQVLIEAGHDPQQPVILAGWSLGGLLATRIAQTDSFKTLFPPIQGLILFAPGVSVRACVGNMLCQIENETLTHSTSLYSRLIRPLSPLYRLNFAAKITLNAHLSHRQPLPTDLPVLTFVAGEEEDRYVNTTGIKKWVRWQRKNSMANVAAYQCPHARHEMDNEPDEFGGRFVREKAVEFALSVVTRPQFENRAVSTNPCGPL